MVLIVLSTNHVFASNHNLQFFITAQLGTHVNRFGLGGVLQNQFNRIHFNQQATLFYNQKYYGGAKHKLSGVVDAALLLNGASMSNAFFSYSKRALQTIEPSEYSLGYQMRWYIMPKHSSQRTATIYTQYRNWYLQSENDALAWSSWDRFRTGNIALGYQKDSLQLQLSTLLFTGSTRHSPQITNEHGCFKNLSAQALGKHSNGVLSLQVGYSKWNQYWATALGYDSEYIRDFFQNKIVHQAKWMKKLNTHIQHCTIPKLQKNGLPCIQSQDKPRPDKFYFQLGVNDKLLY